MLRLKRVYEDYSAFFESKQDKERLRNYLGDNLFNQYMDVREKLPKLSNQFKDFSKIDLNTDNNKKELFNSYNRLIDSLPKDVKSKYKKLDMDITKLSEDQIKDILDDYLEARDIYFKDQERFRSYSQLMKQDIKDIEEWVNNYQSTTSKKRQDKVDGADKLYEDSDWIVYRITTYPAAQLYGSGTKWCITGRYPGHEGEGEYYFNKYIKGNNLDGGYYFYINKKDPNVKYCVLQTKDKEIDSIWDIKDINRGKSYKDMFLYNDMFLPDVPEINLPRFGGTEIFKAIKDNDLDKVKSLINKGVDPNIKVGSGSFSYTPLLYASGNSNTKDIVKYLLDKGAFVNYSDQNGETSLHIASHNGNKDIVELLLKNGANPNVENSGKETPLQDASFNGHKDIVELLLKNGANPDIKDFFGYTPLHLASLEGNKDIIELLLKSGANPFIKNNEGKTMLDIVSEKGYTDILHLLEDEFNIGDIPF